MDAELERPPFVFARNVKKRSVSEQGYFKNFIKNYLYQSTPHPVPSAPPSPRMEGFKN